jgi:hypothetical protein
MSDKMGKIDRSRVLLPISFAGILELEVVADGNKY